ncbi:Chromate resistance protein ChrB [Actinomadura sp. 6N118]|uniref:Chromate resistance protein ChrB n=1 Tax=Actinomadura sp. 6N118 TaxID=3375151 RepID=UPI00379F962C
MLLSYRLPREPSTPRISVWRKLKRLGVAQISDGLVALPADARTREHLEWIADEVTDAGGNATIWFARPANLAQERELATQMAAARAAEYSGVAARAGQAAEAAEPGSAARLAALRRLRAELRRIARRDYFPPAERQHARAAVEALTTGTLATGTPANDTPAGAASAELSPPVPTSQETPPS